MKRKLIFIALCICSLLSTAYAQGLDLASDDFQPNTVISHIYTCNGQNISPELHWSTPPASTKSLVIIMSDPDAPGGTFYHWVVYNMPKSTIMLSQGMLNILGSVAINSYGKAGYNGPCPPTHVPPHRYIIAIYALDIILGLPNNAPAADVIAAMQDHVIAKSETMVYFWR